MNDHVPSQAPLSVVVIARNEEHNIKRCLEAVAWCDERVVVDDTSTDRTAEIARDCGARVVDRRFDTFAGQRNWALEHAGLTNPWVLMLDADEVVTPALRAEIEQELRAAGDDVAAYRMCRRTVFAGKRLRWADGFPVWIMRLVRRGRAEFADSGHGEVPVPPVDGRMGTLREPFDHYVFSKGVLEWAGRHLKYADREAHKEFDERAAAAGQRGVLSRDLWSPDRAVRRRAQRDLSRRVPGRPLLRFLYGYFIKLGILDGRAGLAYCLLMSGYEGLIVLRRKELESDRPAVARRQSVPPPAGSNESADSESRNAVTDSPNLGPVP